MAEGGALWGAVQELRKMSLYKVGAVLGGRWGALLLRCRCAKYTAEGGGGKGALTSLPT